MQTSLVPDSQHWGELNINAFNFRVTKFKHKGICYLKCNCCNLTIIDNYYSSYRYSTLGPFHAFLAMWAQRWCLPHSGVNYLKILCLALPTFNGLLYQLEAATHLTLKLPAKFLCCQDYVSKRNKTILLLRLQSFGMWHFMNRYTIINI